MIDGLAFPWFIQSMAWIALAIAYSCTVIGMVAVGFGLVAFLLYSIYRFLWMMIHNTIGIKRAVVVITFLTYRGIKRKRWIPARIREFARRNPEVFDEKKVTS